MKVKSLRLLIALSGGIFLSTEMSPRNVNAETKVTARSPEDSTKPFPTSTPFPTPTLVPNSFITIPRVLGKIKATDAWSRTDRSSRRSFHAYIDGVFWVTLGRHARIDEQMSYGNKYFVYYPNGLIPQKSNLAKVVNALFGSTEHIDLEITRLYQKVLNRTPTSNERSILRTLKRSGTSDLTLLVQLLSSAEYLGSYPLDERIIHKLFQSTHGREPSAEEKSYWESELVLHSTPTVIERIVYSDSALQNTVSTIFQNYLFRVPTAEEMSNSLSSLRERRMTPNQLAISLLSSHEFYELAFRAMI